MRNPAQSMLAARPDLMTRHLITRCRDSSHHGPNRRSRAWLPGPTQSTYSKVARRAGASVRLIASPRMTPEVTGDGTLLIGSENGLLYAIG